jgi:hypothetical protein
MQPPIQAPPSVKVVGVNGQISLGKQYAGRQVLVEEQEAGVWLIRTATVIPDNERWVHASGVAQQLKSAIAFAQTHPANSANANEILDSLLNGKR